MKMGSVSNDKFSICAALSWMCILWCDRVSVLAYCKAMLALLRRTCAYSLDYADKLCVIKRFCVRLNPACGSYCSIPSSLPSPLSSCLPSLPPFL